MKKIKYEKSEIKKSTYSNVFLVNAKINGKFYGVGVAESLEEAEEMLEVYKNKKRKNIKTKRKVVIPLQQEREKKKWN